MISHMNLQVDDAEKALKMKIRLRNAFLSCYKLNFLAAMPREELHQFLIGLYGEYIIPSAFHSIQSVLRKPEFNLSTNAKGVHKYLVTNSMLEDVWVRLRDRLSSLDSSTSLVEVTPDYAAHFYDMYVEGHTTVTPVTPRFCTASRTICVLEAPLPTRSGTRGTAAGSTR